MGKRGETLQQRPVIPPCRDHPHSPFTKNMLATLSNGKLYIAAKLGA